MRTVAVGYTSAPTSSAQHSINIDGIFVPVSVGESPQPVFDERRLVNSDYVLLQIDAFSCNYRDRSLIVESASKLLHAPSAVPGYFGSEFAGTIVACGASVKRWRIGDRVLPNSAYPQSGTLEEASGIVTNHASSGWLRVHQSRLARIPDAMTTDMAASFSLGAQTAASMIRRAEIGSAEKVLVTSARSNTSLFLIAALNRLGVEVIGTSSSSWSDYEKAFIGPCSITDLPSLVNNYQNPLKTKFDVIFDPFYDVNMAESIGLLRIGGRYVTCGMQNQHRLFTGSTDMVDGEFSAAMFSVISKNLSLIGNCIGTSEDLECALDEYVVDADPVPIDSVFTPDKGGEFLDRVFNTRERFGKVVMRYGS
jgi:NADPH:quinone reductase-like Zn-dependent oxidoreductase